MKKSGFFLVDKPVGRTSFSVCAQIRKAFGVKKVGHTGTLDPFATGLLVVAMGKCTKLIPYLERARKSYQTTIFLGQTSETLDPESEIIFDQDWKKNLKIDANDSAFSAEKINQVLKNHFTGRIKQTPPKYSALKINGKKMCDLARAGKEFEIKERETEVFRVSVLGMKVLDNRVEVRIELEVAAGFYVRCFARDLAQKLGTIGLCNELRRTKVANLSIADAEPVDFLSQPIDPKFILSTIPQREIPLGRVQDFISGRAFPFSGVNGEKMLVLAGSNTIGAGEIIAGKLQPRVVM
jgi:tRNA pseudouridine55 synthase